VTFVCRVQICSELHPTVYAILSWPLSRHCFIAQSNQVSLPPLQAIVDWPFTTYPNLVMADISTDTATQSNPTDIATTHVALVWDIDFDARVLSGHVVHEMNVLTDDVKEIM
jgi:hypothetical protein